jgi:hypothetical protein
MHARELMLGFLERGRRYLWTDAFAVCNLLGLHRESSEGRLLERALDLVDRVHQTLGRDKDGNWLPGASDAHPTRGGLRIGKPLPERAAGEPFDDRLEWERDGQYFHYLTRWMIALDEVGCETGDAKFHTWARELAVTAHRAFCGDGRMTWKRSVDLSRPLVTSMGQHDALDGLVTCMQLQATAGAPSLAHAIADFAAMLDRDRLVTTDPLGLGGLLVDAYRIDRLAIPGDTLRDAILSAARVGLGHVAEHSGLTAPASQRLAFRELGLAIGLDAASRIAGFGTSPTRDAIVQFWLVPAHRRAPWTDHADINDVMLATALRPEGVLGIR